MRFRGRCKSKISSIQLSASLLDPRWTLSRALTRGSAIVEESPGVPLNSVEVKLSDGDNGFSVWSKGGFSGGILKKCLLKCSRLRIFE